MSPSAAASSLLCAANRGVKQLFGSCLRLQHAAVAAWAQPKHQFRPEKVAVVTKTTRYEFEQQRYRYAGLSEEDLKQLVRPQTGVSRRLSPRRSERLFFFLQLAMKGSSYSGLLERHNIHTSNVEHIVKSLR